MRISLLFQNFPKIFGLCVFRAIHFITAITRSSSGGYTITAIVNPLNSLWVSGARQYTKNSYRDLTPVLR